MIIKSIRKIIFAINSLFIILVIAIVCIFFFFKKNFFVSGYGFIEPYNQELIKAPIDGIIEDVYIEEGGQIDKGFPMFNIRGVDEEINNEIALEDYRLQEEIYTNLKELYQKDIVSRREFLEAENKYKIAKINKDRIAKTTIKSSMAGFVISNTELKLKKDDYVQKGTILAKMSDLDEYVVRLNVQEKDVYKIKLSQKAIIQIKGFSNYRAVLNGKVIKILPEGKIDGDKGVFEVIVLLTNFISPSEYMQHIKMFPMMSANVRIMYGHMTFFEYLIKETIGNESN
ncbi:MAG: HlyD family efflux transporter periplasmic adaptor subunit [Endomicrobia bacterium]|nr:HlyD family efflux transporter periplasmic adaptor subunit [Endomicrobiia bacterium]